MLPSAEGEASLSLLFEHKKTSLMSKKLPDYKAQFIDFLVTERALQFGEFTLKNGRISPYFFNTALFNSGKAISRLGYFYAAALEDVAPESTSIFGPAYKGIPLCIATAIAFANEFHHPVGYFFNRKETKTHGDKGILVGKIPEAKDSIMLVDDVITDGATKREALRLVQPLTQAKFSGVLIALDRMETNSSGGNSIAEFQNETGIPVKAIVSIEEICHYLLQREINGSVYLTKATHERIEAYLQKYRIQK